MQSEGERLSRAGNYLLGLMSAADRERAERDLAFDPAFREAVVSVAERLRMLDFAPRRNGAVAHWETIAARLQEMPQMRGLAALAPPNPPRPEEQPLVAIRHPRWWVAAALALSAAFLAGYLVALQSM